MACTGDCNQGRNCDCAPDLPVQYAEGEPFAAEMTALFIIISCVFFMGFYIGRVTA